MGFLSYIILLYMNSSFFTKTILLLYLFLMLYCITIIIYKYKVFYVYKEEINDFKVQITNNSFNYKNRYINLSKKNDLTGLSFIFFSGFTEFINLHRFGLFDVFSISFFLKHVMKSSLIREIIILKKNVHLLLNISYFIRYFSIIYFIFGIFLFFLNARFGFYQDLSLSIIMSGINEFVFQFIVGLFVAFFIQIVYYNLLYRIYIIIDEYNIFINNFIVSLCHKLYD